MNIETAKSSAAFTPLIQTLLSQGIDIENITEKMQNRICRLALFLPRLASICTAKPEYLIPWLQDNQLEKPLTFRTLREEIHSCYEESPDREAAIRRFHRQYMIKIALRDICELVDIKVITEELSDLADVIVDSVYELFFEQLVQQYGSPYSTEKKRESGLSVIALGKQGGRELNFSSDIDLLFVYDEEGETGGGKDGHVSNSSFFTGLTQKICEFLTRSTADGFLYRVDTRLRPEGENGPLASSLDMIEAYYHTYGQNWERQALLKARPIAGNPDTGQRFMKLINPFTYRKYVDEVEIAEALRSIDNMRNRSLEKLGSAERRYKDFKNGYGGIRDIEFFTQSVQILYGGQYPEIRQGGTLLSLLRMHQSGLLHSKEFGFLSLAYRFLRQVEHRLQMVDEQQVYELPETGEAKNLLADSLGYPYWDMFKEQYDKTTRKVREIYEGVFKRKEWEDDTEIFFEKDKYDSKVESVLSQYEFRDPKSAFQFLKDLQKSPDPHLQSKTLRLFKAILPRLLSCLKQSPDADMALSHFEKLVSGFKARSALYESLCDQPAFLDLLVSVISGSSFLTSLILRDPSLMESIGRDLTFEQTNSKAILQRHLGIIRNSYKNEDTRDHLLRVQNAAMLRSGIRFLLGLSSVEEMGRELSHLADFVIEESLPASHRLIQERFPDFTRDFAGEIALIGMGKLGGEEFNVASDCDLVFLYENDHETDEVNSSEYYSRWVAKFIDFQEKKTRLGFLYHIDARLRPHGGNSPMASSFNGFHRYYAKDAQFWEKMALTRARFICGNLSLQNKFAVLKDEILFTRPMSGEETAELLQMRKRIEKEKKEETLKAGPGGLIDVEFIAQALTLRHGWKYPSLRLTSTIEILRAAGKEQLLNRDHARQLEYSYLFLREVENRLRIVNNASLDSIPVEMDQLEKITRRYALRLDIEKPSLDHFLGMVSLHTHKVRHIFNRFFVEL